MTWTHEGSVDDGDFVIYDEETDEEIVEIRHGFITKQHLNLILAAPDLLEALIGLVGIVENYLMIDDSESPKDGSIGQKVRAAIAKATGGL